MSDLGAFFEPLQRVDVAGASGFGGRHALAQLRVEHDEHPFAERIAAVLAALASDLRANGADLSQVTLTSRVEGHRYVIVATAPLRGDVTA